MIKYVIKRDGRKKEFLWDRIKQAIKNAYVDVYKNEDKFKEEYNFLQPMIENELNRKLLLPSEEFLKIELETNELLRVNKQSQADYYTKMVSSGIMSINEVRNELGYNNIEDGDKHFIAYSSTDKNEIGGNSDNSNNNDNNNKE